MDELVTAKSNNDQTGFKTRVWWVLTLCALPPITALLSFSPDGDFAPWQSVLRQFWLPSQLFEIATIVFAFSVGCSAKEEWLRLRPLPKSMIMMWLIFVSLAAAFAEVRGTAVLSLLSWIIHAIFVVSALFLFRRWQDNGHLNIIGLFTDAMPVGGAAYVAVTGLFFLIVGIGADYNWVYALPGFTHMRHSGYFLLPAIAISTGVIATSDGVRKYAHMILLATNVGFAIWIGSRGPLIAYFAVLIGAVLLFSSMRKLRTIAALALALGVGVLVSQVVPTPNHPNFNILSRIESSQSQSADEISSGRTEIWRDTIKGILKQPLIGHGGNQFRFQVPAAELTYNHPHNSILQFGYEWGLIGAFAMLCLLTLLGINLLRATLKYPEINLPLLLAAVSMAAFSLIDGVLYYNLPIMLFAVAAIGIVTQTETAPEK